MKESRDLKRGKRFDSFKLSVYEERRKNIGQKNGKKRTGVEKARGKEFSLHRDR